MDAKNNNKSFQFFCNHKILENPSFVRRKPTKVFSNLGYHKMIEGLHPKRADFFIGRSEENISVSVKRDTADTIKIGDLIRVKIEGRKIHSLWGTAINEDKNEN